MSKYSGSRTVAMNRSAVLFYPWNALFLEMLEVMDGEVMMH